MRRIEDAVSARQHVAGWFGYELGFALEPRLAPLASSLPRSPLLHFGVFAEAEKEAPVPAGRAYAGPLRPEWSKSMYAERFAIIKRYIAAGDIYQANLSFRAEFSFIGDPLALYERLHADSGAPYCAYIDDGERQILSLSPELFFELGHDGSLTAKPMKGTAPRLGKDRDERDALAASMKDRAENLMIVDLIRNDMGRVAETGSVKVGNLFEVETYPTLHTMISTVSARKRSGATSGDLIRAMFPCGSITGAPKIRAMEILKDVESSPRGVYSGAICHFSPDGSARFSVAIRTLTIRDGAGQLGIGGGIVQDSSCEDEYAECLLKAQFYDRRRPPLELIETLRFEREYVRLESHLERMRNSAMLFGLAFDDAKARTALFEAVLGRAGPQRVRLTLDEAGVHRATSTALGSNPTQWTFHLVKEPVSSGDRLLRHKTNWRQFYDHHAGAHGTDEVLFTNERGELTEGARSNVFIRDRGTLLTPPIDAGVLDGRLRRELLEKGEACEASIYPSDLDGEVLFGNSLRGLIPARRIRPGEV